MATGAHLLGGLWDGMCACSGRVWGPTGPVKEGKQAEYIPNKSLKVCMNYPGTWDNSRTYKKNQDFFVITQNIDFTEPDMATGAHLPGGLWDGMCTCSGRVWGPTGPVKEGKQADYIPKQSLKVCINYPGVVDRKSVV